MHIDTYPLSVCVYPKTEKDLHLLVQFSGRYAKKNMVKDPRTGEMRITEVVNHVFANKDKTEIRFLRTMFGEFQSLLQLFGYKEGVNYTVTDHVFNYPLSDKVPTIFEEFQPREEQPALLEFIRQFELGPVLMHLVTGGGKSLSSMFHIQERKSRFVAIMRPKYIGGAGDDPEDGDGKETGWVKSFKKSYDITEDEIYIVAGSQSLKQLIQECLDKTDKYKAILISNKTIISYINSFRRKSKEEFEADGWKCTPFDLPRILGVDTIVSDEIHLDYHQQCILMSYLGVNRILGASATPSPDDRFVDRMLRLLYPVDRRYVQKSHTAYIQPTCYRYRFKNPKAIRCETFRGYTHIGFEQSIMRQTRLKEAYFNIIAEAIDIFYIRKLQLNPDYCCLVMVATIKLARELTDYLSKKYPDFAIKSFVENDPSSNLYYSQICVSTVLGSGTAHDIPNLATVFLTNNISSTQTNLQVAGRLRRLPDGRTPDLVYFISENIKKHRIYDYKKRNETFKDNLLPVNDYYTNKEI